ncbi:MAG: bile acid:sodium symporter family protein, partial [Microcoleaceae cyanobacterium]
MTKRKSYYFLTVFTIVLTVVLNSFTNRSFALNPTTIDYQTVYAQEVIIISQSATPPTEKNNLSDNPSDNPNQNSAVPVDNTAVLFQNDRYAVRVFRDGKNAYINIYNKQNKTLTLKKVPVKITPANDPKKDPIKYIAIVGKEKYIVLLSPLGNSELTILKGNDVLYQEETNRVEIAQKISGISDQVMPVNPTVETAKNLFINFAKLTLFALMFSMAIRWTFDDVIWLWKQPALLGRSLLSVFVLVPLFGVLIIVLMPGLTVSQRIGIASMIACPGAPMIAFKSLKVGGNAKFVASLQFIICTIAIISIPLTIFLLSQLSPHEAWLSQGKIATQVFFAQVLPMGLGVLIAEYLPELAEDLVEPISKISKLMLLVTTLILLTLTLDKVLNAGFFAYFAMVLMAIASLAFGHFLGGPQPENTSVLAYATATRNPGLAILLVSL